jgi:hypothetical protein
MNNKAKGVAELLNLIKNRPDLVHALVLDPAKVKSVLKTKSAKQLVSTNTRAFLDRLGGPEDGGGVTVCQKGTAHMCAKGTQCPKPTKTPNFAQCGNKTVL